MIDPRSLRIGNLLGVFGTNGNPDMFIEMAIIAPHIQTAVEHPEWFQPIPLSAEKLISLGFFYVGKETYTPKGSYKIVRDMYRIKSGGGYSFDVGLETIQGYDAKPGLFIEGLPDIDIEFVHSLQNLYYALTSEELVYTKKNHKK